MWHQHSVDNNSESDYNLSESEWQTYIMDSWLSKQQQKMGNIFKMILDKFDSSRKFRILMLGLDAAGKTTISQKLRLDESVTVPTIGFNVDEVTYKNVTFVIWDVGGQDKIRQQWVHFYHNIDAIIFVVDSEDKQRLQTVADELNKLCSHHHLQQTPFLVYANKQDSKNALSLAQIVRQINIPDILKQRQWQIQATCALTGDGLYEGLDWVNKVLMKSK